MVIKAYTRDQRLFVQFIKLSESHWFHKLETAIIDKHDEPIILNVSYSKTLLLLPSNSVTANIVFCAVLVKSRLSLCKKKKEKKGRCFHLPFAIFSHFPPQVWANPALEGSPTFRNVFWGGLEGETSSSVCRLFVYFYNYLRPIFSLKEIHNRTPKH